MAETEEYNDIEPVQDLSETGDQSALGGLARKLDASYHVSDTAPTNRSHTPSNVDLDYEVGRDNRGSAGSNQTSTRGDDDRHDNIAAGGEQHPELSKEPAGQFDDVAPVEGGEALPEDGFALQHKHDSSNALPTLLDDLTQRNSLLDSRFGMTGPEYLAALGDRRSEDQARQTAETEPSNVRQISLVRRDSYKELTGLDERSDENNLTMSAYDEQQADPPPNAVSIEDRRCLEDGKLLHRLWEARETSEQNAVEVAQLSGEVAKSQETTTELKLRLAQSEKNTRFLEAALGISNRKKESLTAEIDTLIKRLKLA